MTITVINKLYYNEVATTFLFRLSRKFLFYKICAIYGLEELDMNTCRIATLEFQG